jgi:hypothetical protein
MGAIIIAIVIGSCPGRSIASTGDDQDCVAAVVRELARGDDPEARDRDDADRDLEEQPHRHPEHDHELVVGLGLDQDVERVGVEGLEECDRARDAVK